MAEDKEAKKYTLRDERGTLKAEVTEAAAQTLVQRAGGAWTNYLAEGSPLTRAFVFNDDYRTSALLPHGTEHDINWGVSTLYIWKGDVLIAPAEAPAEVSENMAGELPLETDPGGLFELKSCDSFITPRSAASFLDRILGRKQ